MPNLPLPGYRVLCNSDNTGGVTSFCASPNCDASTCTA